MLLFNVSWIRNGNQNILKVEQRFQIVDIEIEKHFRSTDIELSNISQWQTQKLSNIPKSQTDLWSGNITVSDLFGSRNLKFVNIVSVRNLRHASISERIVRRTCSKRSYVEIRYVKEIKYVSWCKKCCQKVKMLFQLLI